MRRAQNAATEPEPEITGAEDLHAGDTESKAAADDAWAASLRSIFHDVIASLPDHATLGELVEAARSNRAIAPVLGIFTVQELIDLAKTRPRADAKPRTDNGGDDALDLDAGPKVIRRRADVPDGDLRVLRCLSSKGAQREADLAHQTKLTAEQLRIIVRHLRTKGYIHVEGSGSKRKLKITRNGSGFVKRQA